MSRGRRISETVEKLIIQESLENPNIPRRILALKLRDYIDRMGEPVPTEETLVKMISKIRTETPDPLDKLWSLKDAIDKSFPVEATPYLLRAWKMSLALGLPFTIRHAKWASYLCTVTDSVMDLIVWSDHYAKSEKVHKVLEIPFTSVDLDASLTSSFSEIRSLALLGKMKPIPITGGGIISRPKPVSFTEDSLEVYKEVEYTALASLRLSSSSYAEALRQSDNDRNVLPPMEELNLPQDFIWIYCYWLTSFSLAPNWRQLTRSEAIDVIKELRQWITTQPEINNRISQDELKVMLENKKYISPEEQILHLELAPPESLLKKIGYLSEDSTSNDLGSIAKRLPGDWTILLKRVNTYNSKLGTYIAKKKNSTSKEKNNARSHSQKG